MTASGTCHACEKVAFKFHYITSYNGDGKHDGYWHCEDHGPSSITESSRGKSKETEYDMSRMNRAERRFYARKGCLPV